MRRSRDGGVVDLNEGVLEKKIAAALIEWRLPLRGAELAFLRKTLGLSLNQFARKPELTVSSIFQWEKAASALRDAFTPAWVGRQKKPNGRTEPSDLSGRDSL